MYLVFFCN